MADLMALRLATSVIKRENKNEKANKNRGKSEGRVGHMQLPYSMS